MKVHTLLLIHLIYDTMHIYAAEFHTQTPNLSSKCFILVIYCHVECYLHHPLMNVVTVATSKRNASWRRHSKSNGIEFSQSTIHILHPFTCPLVACLLFHHPVFTARSWKLF